MNSDKNRTNSQDSNRDNFQSQHSTVKPVRYKELFTDPEKRSEQLKKIVDYLEKIIEEQTKSPNQENLQNLEKLNYYLFTLSPEDRMDVLRECCKRPIFNFRLMFAYLTNNLVVYSTNFKKTKFPKISDSLQNYLEVNLKLKKV